MSMRALAMLRIVTSGKTLPFLAVMAIAYSVRLVYAAEDKEARAAISALAEAISKQQSMKSGSASFEIVEVQQSPIDTPAPALHSRVDSQFVGQKLRTVITEFEPDGSNTI